MPKKFKMMSWNRHPHKKILVQFQNLVYYRQYIIRDRRSTLTYAEGMEISKLKIRVEGL